MKSHIFSCGYTVNKPLLLLLLLLLLLKNAVQLEKNRSDIFPSLGLPLCALELKIAAAFGR